METSESIACLHFVAKAKVSLIICTDLPRPLLLADEMLTKTSCSGAYLYSCAPNCG